MFSIVDLTALYHIAPYKQSKVLLMLFGVLSSGKEKEENDLYGLSLIRIKENKTGYETTW